MNPCPFVFCLNIAGFLKHFRSDGPFLLFLFVFLPGSVRQLSCGLSGITESSVITSPFSDNSSFITAVSAALTVLSHLVSV